MAQLHAGIPIETPIATVNRQCSSGLTAVNDIANQITSGQIDIGIGESWSFCCFSLVQLGYAAGNVRSLAPRVDICYAAFAFFTDLDMLPICLLFVTRSGFERSLELRGPCAWSPTFLFSASWVFLQSTIETLACASVRRSWLTLLLHTAIDLATLVQGLLFFVISPMHPKKCILMLTYVVRCRRRVHDLRLWRGRAARRLL
jgi:hypothetical protein